MTKCFTDNVVLGCYNDGTNPPQTIMVHVRTGAAGEEPEIRYTDNEGAIIAGADETNVSLGACAALPADVEFEILTDVLANGDRVEFARRKITTFDAMGVPTVTVDDFEMDYTTPYTVQGTVTSAPDCDPLAGSGIQSAW